MQINHYRAPSWNQPGFEDSALGHLFERDPAELRPLQKYLAEQGAGLERATFWERSSTILIPALLTGFAAMAILLGLFYRSSPMIQSRWQARAAGIRVAVAVAWIASASLLIVWQMRVLRDPAYAVYDWPHPPLLASSWLALFAALGSVALVALLPLVWRSERASKGWSRWRRARFTYTVFAFSLFALVLAVRGGLQPWNS